MRKIEIKDEHIKGTRYEWALGLAQAMDMLSRDGASPEELEQVVRWFEEQDPGSYPDRQIRDHGTRAL